MELPRLEDTFLVSVVVHQALGNRLGIWVVADLPGFGNVLQRGDEALARRSVIHGRYARSLVARSIQGRDDPDQAEVFSIEQHQAVWQVIGDHDPLAVTGNGRVARVQPGPDFSDDGQVVDVELGNPAIARSKIDKAPIRRELRAAVQGISAGESIKALEGVAIQHRHVMVAGFNHDEKVERIGSFESGAGFGRKVFGIGVDNV